MVYNVKYYVFEYVFGIQSSTSYRSFLDLTEKKLPSLSFFGFLDKIGLFCRDAYRQYLATVAQINVKIAMTMTQIWRYLYKRV